MLSKPSAATTAQTKSLIGSGSHDKISKPRESGSKGFSEDNQVKFLLHKTDQVRPGVGLSNNKQPFETFYK